jgi:hypothetical protein
LKRTSQVHSTDRLMLITLASRVVDHASREIHESRCTERSESRTYIGRTYIESYTAVLPYRVRYLLFLPTGRQCVCVHTVDRIYKGTVYTRWRPSLTRIPCEPSCSYHNSFKTSLAQLVDLPYRLLTSSNHVCVLLGSRPASAKPTERSRNVTSDGRHAFNQRRSHKIVRRCP